MEKQKHAGQSVTVMLSPASIAANMRLRQNAKIEELRRALIEEGFDTVAKQALALGLSRSSAWAILQAQHKNRGLCPHLIRRILTAPHLPPKARAVIESYVRERLLGDYGHARKSLRTFEAKLGPVELGFSTVSDNVHNLPDYSQTISFIWQRAGEPLNCSVTNAEHHGLKEIEP